MDALLRITKRPAGRELAFDFLLSYMGQDAMATRSVKSTRYDTLHKSIFALQGHIDSYRDRFQTNHDSSEEVYRSAVLEWIVAMSGLVSKELLPAEDTGFAKLMRDVEGADDNDVGLLVASNDFAVPWWLATSYSNPSETWSSLLACGFLPISYLTVGSERTLPYKRPIMLLSRPSTDLRQARDLRNDLGSPTGEVEILDGSHNSGRGGPGFGLTRDDVMNVFQQTDVIFYYRHFSVDDADPRSSYFELLPEYLAGRRASEVENGRLTIEEVEDLIQDKLIFVDACRSVGLPLLDSGSAYPADDDTLPAIYAGKNATCLGTLYPIFDDAAVKYISAFAAAVTEGGSVGSAMRIAQRKLRSDRSYTAFDWNAYILIGRPGRSVVFA